MIKEGHFISNVSDYISWTETTAVYPRGDHAKEMDYLNLGLIGECGEVAQMLKRKVRDPFYQFTREDMLHELGDIAWYYARIHYDHSFDRSSPEKLSETQELLEKYDLLNSDFLDNGIGCMQIGLAMFKKWIQDNKNKHIMEALGFTSQEIRQAVINKLPDLLQAESGEEAMSLIGLKLDEKQSKNANMFFMFRAMAQWPSGQLISEMIDDRDSPVGATEWAILCDRFGFEPLEVLQANFDKLESRKNRGKLHGTGDTR